MKKHKSDRQFVPMFVYDDGFAGDGCAMSPGARAFFSH